MAEQIKERTCGVSPMHAWLRPTGFACAALILVLVSSCSSQPSADSQYAQEFLASSVVDYSPAQPKSPTDNFQARSYRHSQSDLASDLLRVSAPYPQ